MTETITRNTVRCDCCLKEINTPSFIVNSAPDPYYSHNGVDLCNTCTLAIARRLFRKVPEDEMEQLIKDAMPYERRYNLPPGITLC